MRARELYELFMKKYKLILHANGRKYKAEGSSMLSAIKKFGIIPAKTHGVLQIECGKKKAEKIMPIVQIRRFLGKYTLDVNRIVFAKNLSLLLEG